MVTAEAQALRAAVTQAQRTLSPSGKDKGRGCKSRLRANSPGALRAPGVGSRVMSSLPGLLSGGHLTTCQTR